MPPSPTICLLSALWWTDRWIEDRRQTLASTKSLRMRLCFGELKIASMVCTVGQNIYFRLTNGPRFLYCSRNFCMHCRILFLYWHLLYVVSEFWMSRYWLLAAFDITLLPSLWIYFSSIWAQLSYVFSFCHMLYHPQQHWLSRNHNFRSFWKLLLEIK